MSLNFCTCKNAALLWLTFCFISFKSISQDPRLVPLPPNAAAFTKAGDFRVGALSGRPEINFPIYTVESGNLKLPISLSYDASGIQVNQVSSWVGLGWSLNAGGLISRTVRGIPDDLPTYGWIDDQTSNADLAYSTDYLLRKSYVDMVKDGAPDFYSYNMPGKFGKFIFRKITQKFETIPFEPIDVVFNKGTAETNHFHIVDNDGTKYFFEYKKRYINLENTVGTPQSLKNYIQSWYLTKMVSANNTDTITLKYELKPGGGSGVDSEWWLLEKSYQRSFSKMSNVSTPYTDNGTAETITMHGGTEPVLTEISFRNGKIILHSNTGRRDFPGPMLDSITVFNSKKTIRKIKFNYDYFIANQAQMQNDYRLKLLSFSNIDIEKKLEDDTHRFEYDESVKLPSTGSTAQDYWGYYNGNDQAFLPNKAPGHADLYTPYIINNIKLGNADRSVSDSHLKAGLLKKIVYPTGGYSIFDFESNRYYAEPNTTVISGFVAGATVYGIDKNILKTSVFDFVWKPEYLNGSATMHIYFSPSQGPGPFDLVDMQKIELLDITAGTVIGTWSHVTNIYSSQEYSLMIYGFVPGHQYRLIGSVKNEPTTYLTASLTALSYQTSPVTGKSGGGLRIKEISNYHFDNSMLSKSVYTYSSRNGEGVGIYLRSDKSFEENYFTRKTWVVDPQCYILKPACDCIFNYKNEIIYVGSGSLPQVTLQGASVVYDNVTKTNYDQQGNKNGQIMYAANQDIPSNTSIYNPNLPGEREYINNVITIPRIPSEFHYAYNKTTNKFFLVKEKLHDYSLQHIGNEPLTALYRTMFFPALCPNGYVQSTSDITHMQYNINLGTYKLKKSTERDYDLAGNMTVENVTDYFYDNQNHMELTRVERKGSDGIVLKEVIKYADDFTDNSYGSQLLRAKSIKSFPLEVTSMKGSTIVKKQANTYGLFGLNLWVEKVETTFGTTLTDVLRYDKYDMRGNPLEIQKIVPGSPPFKVTYQWGYQSSYPVTEVKNASYTDVFFLNFEDGSGNSLAGDSNTGSYSKTGGFTKSLSGLNNGAYTLSYWLKGVNQWNLTTQDIQVTTGGYIINISGQVDDILFIPKAAESAISTHVPLVGITSQIDSKGQKTYYEYDGLNRLKCIKDQKGNIIKSYDYHYKL